MRARSGFLIALALLVAAACGWWFASPWWTLRQMREAAQAHDSAKLSAYVDYPALRENLKDQLMTQVTGDRRGVAGLGSIGAAVATAIAGPVIDAAVTPQGVEAMFRVEDLGADARALPGSSSLQLQRLPRASDRPTIAHNGFDRFSVEPREGGGATMHFQRRGLGWRLTAIDLPPPASRRLTD